jgi:quercetin dioxygenase-like cupin family protein
MWERSMNGPDDPSLARMRAPLILRRQELPTTEHAEEFVGAAYGDVPFSLILVHAPPGAGPALHRHPYAEVFIVESGEATFQLGESVHVVRTGQIVVGPPDVPHGFHNSGADELRLTAVHGAGRFDTEWLAGEDVIWASGPKP